MSSNAKLISEYFIRPKTEINESKRIYHLNPFDLRLLLVENTQSGFLHVKPNNFSPSAFLDKLRFTLSQTLVYFYPVAGQLVSVPNEDDSNSTCVYVDCAKGPGARLIHASARDLTMSDVLKLYSNGSKVIRSFFDLGESSVNYDGHTRPLMSVQVTVLEDGVFMGFCYNHCAIDGISIVHFQTIWINIFRGTFSSSNRLPRVEKPDFLEKRVFRVPSFDPDKVLTRTTVEDGFLRERLFKFSPESLKKLKSMANSDQANKTISTFMALIAFVWKCVTRVRNLSSDEVTTCALAVNLRPRFDPPMSNDYYGGYAVKARGSTKVVDLVNNSIGWVATLLQQTVAALDDKAAREWVSRADDKGVELVKPTQTTAYSSNVMVGGSATFPISKNTFGLGKLVAFRGGYGNKVDGKIDAYLGSQGDGSVDLEICLAPFTLNALEFDQEFMAFASQNNGDFNLISNI